MSMNKYYGIDVGGTTVKLGLFSDSELLEKWEIPTDISNGGKNIIKDIVRSLPDKAEGAAIGVPGAVLPDGTVNRCVNLGWGICRPADEFTALTGIPCRMCNDANAAAMGEQWRGGGAGYRSILMVTLGTGVGGGLVMEDSLITGIHGAAAEIGHICVNPAETELCNCGNCGCLEQYCSATGITRLGNLAGHFVAVVRRCRWSIRPAIISAGALPPPALFLTRRPSSSEAAWHAQGNFCASGWRRLSGSTLSTPAARL